MARHVDPDDHSFRRSLLRAAAGGLAALVVTFGVTAVLAQIGRQDPPGTPAIVATVEGLPSPSPAPRPTASTSAAPAEPTVAPASDIPAEPVTVQVLYLPALEDLAGEAAEVLRDLGYEVAAVNSTAREVDVTTVLATPGHEDDAAQLRERDPRFAELGENTDFNASVDLHVLIGPDFDD